MADRMRTDAKALVVPADSSNPYSDPAPAAAGREMDAAIAEKIFGWTDVRDHQMWSMGDEGGEMEPDGSDMMGQRPANERMNPEQYSHVPHYSTQIAAAWLVVEAMQKQGYVCDINIDCFPNGEAADVTVEFWKSAFARSGEFDAATAPHAICLAALSLASTNRAAVRPPIAEER